MTSHPCKIRLQRRRGEVIIDILVPKSSSGWYVKESVNMGAVTLREAVLGLKDADLSKAPLLATALVGEVT